MTREHWQAMGMQPVARLAEPAARARTEILSEVALAAVWAPTMAAIAAKEAARDKRA